MIGMMVFKLFSDN